MRKAIIAMKMQKKSSNESLPSLVLAKIGNCTLGEFISAKEFVEQKIYNGDIRRLATVYYLADLIIEQIRMQRYYDACVNRYKKAASQTDTLQSGKPN